MKLFRFIKYDFDEGIAKYWKRYLMVILFAVFFFFSTSHAFSFGEKLVNEHTSFIEYGLSMFWGKDPYVFSPASPISFDPDYLWIFLFMLLMFVISSYVVDSMREFGIMLIMKSGGRIRWWFSKCIWCVCVNLLFFGLVWLTIISCIWLKDGEIHMKSRYLLDMNYPFLSQEPFGRVCILTMVMPLLTGITCSLLMLVISLFAGSVGAIPVLLLLIIFGQYYATGINPYEYGMIIRYYEMKYDSSVPPHHILNLSHGIIYLCVLCVVLVVIGYFVIKKKNLIEKKLI